MHEVSLAQSLCAEVAESARQHGMGRVLKVKLTVGQDCMVMPEALLFAFDLLKPDPLMASAVLELEEVPGWELVIQHIEGVP